MDSLRYCGRHDCNIINSLGRVYRCQETKIIMENIEIYATAVGTIVIVIGVVITMATECRKQINRVYQRFDEYKEHLEKTHVSKEVHDIKYDQLKSDINEIKTDVKQLLKKANGK